MLRRWGNAMKAHFQIDPNRLRDACVLAVKNIRKRREEKTRKYLADLCETLNKEDNACLLKRIGLMRPNNKYDAERLFTDEEYREEFFRGRRLAMTDSWTYYCMASHASCTEERCQALLCACDAAIGPIDISASEWRTIHCWAFEDMT